ncbi:J domain-containing protein [Paraflavitalea speifideaquila]|uniref:J domain-containing protein n=1 Tax=Paraflavitalea speifideaquila TaxID=3076558 RepID=UPI0028EE3863|nr:J domain-containing protein [Paraflavitalea speifideiaquila]
MQLKDYYKILEVTPLATLQEIKKSFRQLALKYHPDKNAGDHLSAALFREIQEAWEVLSDPKQREDYNYKRWYNRSIGEIFAERALTPAAILAECERVMRYVNSMNIFQVDFDALSFHIRQLLSDSNIGILQQANEVATNRAVNNALIKAADPLPLTYLQPIALLLIKLAGQDEFSIRAINSAVQQRKRRAAWDKYKWMVVVAITALICWIMYLAGNTK